ncbi:MAG: Major Facilitator Superfamily protein [Promethearchaeota archaeon]|nr:MAG: Major Facilitator Superfamily protein [Candidatus Lokiarchaeota archaeon]
MLKRQSKAEERTTEDFKSMIRISILNSLGFFYLGFIIPIIAKENMGASVLVVGLIISSLVLGNTISSSFVGILTDRVNSKSSLVFLGSIFRGIAYIITYIAIIINSPMVLFIGGFLIGIGAGLFWTPFDTLVAEKSAKEHRSYAFGKRDSANAIGQTIGALFGFTLFIFAEQITQNAFLLYLSILVFGIANFLAGILFLRQVDDKIQYSSESSLSTVPSLEDVPDSDHSFSTLLLIATIILFAVTLISNVNAYIWRPFLNIYIIEFITEDLNIVILIYLPSGVIATLVAPKLGEIMDKINPRLGIVITSSIGALLTWLLINIKSILLFAVIVLFDITIALAAGLLFRNILSRVNIKHRGKIIGYTNFSINLGSIIGPILGGYLWDTFTPQFPFIVSIFAELALIPLFLLVVKLLIPHMAESFEKRKK